MFLKNTKLLWQTGVMVMNACVGEARTVCEGPRLCISRRTDSYACATEENKQHAPDKENGDIHGKVVSMTFTHHQQPEFTIVQQTKPKYRSLLPTDSACAKAALTARISRSNERDRVPFPSAPAISQNEFPVHDEGYTRHRPFTHSSLMSPPLTPKLSLQEVFDGPLHSPSERRAVTTHPVVPPSPYDPTATPSFRHSPPTLPWDQPWRFPSPSHPLHSRARELSLSMLTTATVSPAVKGPSASPSVMTSSPITSPGAIAVTEDAHRVIRPSPKSLFSRGQLPVPITDRMYTETHRSRIQESPLSRNARPRHSSLKAVSETTEEWFSDAPLNSSPGLVRSASDGLLDGSNPLDVHDPFSNIYRPWVDTGYRSNDSPQDSTSPPVPTSEVDSPVLRANTLPGDDGIDGSKPASVGLGMGLMEPFGFLGDRMEGEFYGLVFSSLGDVQDENEVEAALASLAYDHVGSNEYFAGYDIASPSRKKRRTVDNLA